MKKFSPEMHVIAALHKSLCDLQELKEAHLEAQKYLQEAIDRTLNLAKSKGNGPAITYLRHEIKGFDGDESWNDTEPIGSEQ